MKIEKLVVATALDKWLSEAYRKYRTVVPKDEDSLFRAVAVQLYPCQNYFEHAKEKVFNTYFSESIISMDAGCDETSADFRKLTEYAQLEAVSKAFQRNIILYTTEDHPPVHIGKCSGTKEDLCLRLSDEGFYECIQDLSRLESLALCQSVVYEMLYEKVFGFEKSEIEETVWKVRNTNKHDSRIIPTKLVDGCEAFHPKFPYRIVKSLDPIKYRNVSYEIWHDYQDLSEGDLVTVPNEDDEMEQLTGFVQSISLEAKTANIFLDKFAERRDYNLIDIKPVRQSRPSSSRERSRRTYDHPCHFNRQSAFHDSLSSQHYTTSPDSNDSDEKRNHARRHSSQASNGITMSYISTPPPQHRVFPPPSGIAYQTLRHAAPQFIPTEDPVRAQPSSPWFPSCHPYIVSPLPMQPPLAQNYATELPGMIGQIYPSQQNSASMFYSSPLSFSQSSSQPQPVSAYGNSINPMSAHKNPKSDSLKGEKWSEEKKCMAPCTPTKGHGVSPAIPDMQSVCASYPPSTANQYSPIHIAVPYLDTIQGQVDFHMQPSVDELGRDLPLTDVNTMRYFFNLGVEVKYELEVV